MRRFTVDEANALLPGIEAQLVVARSARDRLVDAGAYVSEKATHNGGGKTPPLDPDAQDDLSAALHAIAEMGVILRDVDSGLLDFPAQRDGEDMFLCWRSGEDEVGFWHPLDSGFSGRQPLESAG